MLTGLGRDLSHAIRMLAKNPSFTLVAVVSREAVRRFCRRAIAVAQLAGFLPARRAVRLDPLVTLRCD